VNQLKLFSVQTMQKQANSKVAALSDKDNLREARTICEKRMDQV